VEGIVNHESYLTNRIVNPAGPMSGARVVVTEGPGVGATVTTGADGVYHFDLPPGPFRVRWSAEFFETRERREHCAGWGDHKSGDSDAAITAKRSRCGMEHQRVGA
jgi:hypothetical protein